MSRRKINREVKRQVAEILKAQEKPKEERLNWGTKEKSLPKKETIRDLAEKAIKSHHNAEAYKTMGAIKAIPNDTDRQLVMDSYTDYFTNAGIYSFNSIVHSRFMGYAFLSYLYQDAMINKGITIMSDELTRKWGKCISTTDSDEKVLKLVNDKLEELNTKHRFRESAIYTGFFGGCLIYMDLRNADGSEPDDAELELPLFIDGKEDLNKAKLQGMKLVGLKPIEPINISPGEFNSNDPKKENFYKPTHFYVLGKKIHRSRFLYFADLIPPMVLKPVYMFFGIPLAQLAFDYVQDFYSNKEVVSKIIKKFSLLTFKTDTQKLLQNGDSGVEDRIATMAKYRDNDSVFIVDINEEDVAQINTPLTGLKEIWYANLELLPVVFGLPVNKLLQTSPSGFNATGDFDMRSFYDSVNTKQAVLFGEPMDRLIDIICLTLGIERKGIKFKWTSLFELSEKEQAEVNNIKANTDNTLNQIGAVSNVEVAKRLNADENSDYNGLEIPEEINPNDVDVNLDNPDGEKKKGIEDAEFIESEHPRDDDGKFKEKGTSSSSSEQISQIPDKIYLNVPYSEKDEAKSFGAKWDGDKKKWYVPKGVAIDNFSKWEQKEIKNNFEVKETSEKTNIRKINENTSIIEDSDDMYLLNRNGIEFYVYKKWVREDGTLTEEAEMAYRTKLPTKYEARISRLKKDGVKFDKTWESAKAVATDVEVDTNDGKTVRIFIPKSLLNEKGNAPYWFIKKKIEENDLNLIRKSGLDDYFGDNEKKGIQDSIKDKEIYIIINGKFYLLKEKTK